MSAAQHSQLDLFSQRDVASSSRSVAKPSLLLMMKERERALLLVIGFIITVAVSYSSGYEQGRRIARLRGGQAFDTASAGTARALPPPAHPTAAKAPQQPRSPASTSFVTAGAYTIQLASYKSRAGAERESAALKKKGYSPLLLTKGEYVVLCVGSFSEARAARILQAELAKRYQGCYIRRI